MAPISARRVCSDMVWPPGFRFHPTDEELVIYYLKRKISQRKLKLDVISVIDVYKWDPEDLPGLSLLKTGDRQWFFFSPRDRKYPSGSRANRATRHGYWKATGKDRSISWDSRTVGVKKTLVFYKGRAPNGERTDWVMHEYTLDDDELKRCQNPQDYYALCKVYKKSGPGPKIGEQYGAPYREEDWADDENPQTIYPALQEDPLLQVNEIASADNFIVDPQQQSEFHKLEELMNQLVDDDAVREQVLGNVDNYVNPVTQLACEQDTRAESCAEDQCSNWKTGMSTNLELIGSSASQLQICKAPLPTYVVDAADMQHHVANHDYLELDDLLLNSVIYADGRFGSQPSSGGLLSVQMAKNELDLYYDANMFLRELVPGDEATATFADRAALTQPYSNPQSSELGIAENELDVYYDAGMFFRDLGHASEVTSTFVDQAVVTQPYTNAGSSELHNPIQYQLHQHGAIIGNAGTVLCMDDESCYDANFAQVFNDAAFLPSSGIYTGIPLLSNATESNQNQGNDADGADPWLTNALWSFVESIPSSPALAAESIMVKQALERISSFGRLRVNLKRVAPTTSTGSAGGWVKGLFLFSLLVAVLGIFCAVIGSAFS